MTAIVRRRDPATDAARLITELESINHDLLEEVGRLRRRRNGSRLSQVRAERHANEMREVVRRACGRLGLNYDAITAKNQMGNLLRSPMLLRDRMRLVEHLRRPTATPSGRMSFTEIADGLGLASHSTIVQIERRIKAAVREAERRAEQQAAQNRRVA